MCFLIIHSLFNLGCFKIIIRSNNRISSPFLEFFPSDTGLCSSFFGRFFVWNEALSVFLPSNACSRCFTKHGKDKFQVIHMVSKVFTFQSLYFFIFIRSQPKTSLADLCGKERILLLLLNSSHAPFVRKFVSYRNASHSFLNPII